MTEQPGTSENDAAFLVGKLFDEINQAKSEESLVQNIRKRSLETCERIVKEKGRWQPPELRMPEYIRGITESVPIKIHGLEFGVSIFEVVNTQRMWSAQDHEPIAVTDRYLINFDQEGQSIPLFSVGSWRPHVNGWRGQNVSLEEAKMIPIILDYIDMNLPQNPASEAPNTY